MSETQISFLDSMVDAIRTGKKTQTRRPIKRVFLPEPTRIVCWSSSTAEWAPESNSGKMFLTESWRPFKCRYGKPGNHLVVADGLKIEVVNITTERVQDITETDAEAEGVEQGIVKMPYSALFGELWNSIYEKQGYGWSENPFVWRIVFKPIEG